VTGKPSASPPASWPCSSNGSVALTARKAKALKLTRTLVPDEETAQYVGKTIYLPENGSVSEEVITGKTYVPPALDTGSMFMDVPVSFFTLQTNKGRTLLDTMEFFYTREEAEAALKT
jgi:hypothetical protein